MIEVNTIVFVILVELLIVLLVLSAGLAYVLMRMKNSLSSGQEMIDELKNRKPDASLYFKSESRMTTDRHSALGLNQEKRKSWCDLEHEAVLLVRADLLNLEKEYAKIPEERDDSFWAHYHKSFEELLKKHELYNCLHARFMEDETGIRELFSTTKDEIEQLRQYVDTNIADKSVKAELSGLLDSLVNRQREMGDCIFVLEDESAFLRDQVATLLK